MPQIDDIHRLYNILGLKPGASQDEVKQAYRDLVRVWHPDRFSHDTRLQKKAQEKMGEINRAYERLESFLRGEGYQARQSQRHPETAGSRSAKSQDVPKGPLHNKTAQKIVFQVQAVLVKLESKLRPRLARVGIKVPPLTDEGRMIAVLLLFAAIYLIVAAAYLILNL